MRFSRFLSLFLIRKALVVSAICALSLSSFAHEIMPNIINVKVTPENKAEFALTVNLEALIAEIGPEHEDTDDSPNKAQYDALRALPPADLEQRFQTFFPQLIANIEIDMDGKAVDLGLQSIEIADIGDLDLSRDTELTLVSANPVSGPMTFRWKRIYGDVILRVTNESIDEEGVNGEQGIDAYYITSGERSVAFSLQAGASRTWVDTAIEYIEIGYVHIIPKGLDHILFVVGLFLLTTRLVPLLWQITAFTLAHSITLALGLLGVVTLSPDIVEPLIALSIAFVALENIVSSNYNKWRPVIVFVFGLLHGLGFAGVLSEIGIPSGQFALSLISFNIGVELGQISVVLICLALVWFIRNKPWYRNVVVIPVSFVIAMIGVYWTLERGLGLSLF